MLVLLNGGYEHYTGALLLMDVPLADACVTEWRKPYVFTCNLELKGATR